MVTWSTYDNGSTYRFPFCLGVFCKQLPVSHPFPDAAGLVGDLILFVDPNISITTSHKSRAGNPSIRSPVSNEMISDSVELWDTDVCFLHIQLIGTNVRLPKIHKIPPLLILSPQGLEQNLSLGINPIDNAVP